MMYPLVRELAVDKIPVVVTCRVLGFSKQAYFKWLAKPVSDRDWADAHLINAAIDIHHDDPAFGYRFIADERPAVGITAGENRVARLCSQQRIFSIFAKKRGLNRKAGPPVHDDLVDREFTATAPNRLWLTDIPVEPGWISTSLVILKRATVRLRPAIETPSIAASPGCSARRVTPGERFDACRLSLPNSPSRRQTTAPDGAAATASCAAFRLATTWVQSVGAPGASAICTVGVEVP